MAFYRLQNHLYRVAVRNGGLALVKAGKAPAPGQMSLLDGGSWDEDQHPRDEQGKFTSKARAHSKMQAALPDAIANFRSKAEGMISGLKNLGYQDAQNLDIDRELNDKHWVEMVQHLEDHAKDGEHPDLHEEITGHVDEFVDSYPELQGLYDSHHEQAEQAISDRIDEIEELITDAHISGVQGFQEDWDRISEGDEDWTFADWQKKKEEVTQAYKTRLKEGLQKLLDLQADSEAVTGFMDEMSEFHEDALDSYSDDPDDYE